MNDNITRQELLTAFARREPITLAGVQFYGGDLQDL